MSKVPTWKLCEAIVYDLKILESSPELFYRFSRIIGVYVSPLHDRDVFSSDEYDDKGVLKHKEGDTKKPHYHLICHMKNGLSLKSIQYEVMSYITSQNCRVIPIKDIVSAHDYLNHKGFEDKFLYLENYKTFGDVGDIEQRIHCGRDKNKQFLYDLNILSEFELAIRYGRDFIKNRESYLTFRNDVFIDELDPNAQEEFDSRKRYYKWLKIVRPPYEYSNYDDFLRFEKINGKFVPY